jgi:hypothetical protein
MKIVVEKATRKAFYLFADEDDSLSLGEYLFSSTFIAADIKADTHEIVTGPAPEEWIGGGVLAFDGSWSISDQSAYDQYQQGKTEYRAADVRTERNAKLSASDWTQVADAPVDKDEWAAYRQALRDISDQEGFPWTIVWPVAP